MLGEYAIKTSKFDKSYEFNLTRTYSTYRLKIDPFHFKRERGWEYSDVSDKIIEGYKFTKNN
jgi:hypothetical protein